MNCWPRLTRRCPAGRSGQDHSRSGTGFRQSARNTIGPCYALPTLVGLGFPVLIGASRKRFLGSLLAAGGTDRPPAGREVATAAISALAAAGGAWGAGP